MIRPFADKRTLLVWERRRTKLHPETQRRACNKLAMLNRAATLDDLRVPPGDRLEQLKGDRAGQHSIRVNDRAVTKDELGDTLDSITPISV